MANDDFMPDFDPYDILQEHDLVINRLIKAHNQQEKYMAQMAKNAELISRQLLEITRANVEMEKRIQQLTQRIQELE